ncbi:ArsR/SmtB family transcription factor [Desulfolucanica intricata]|uniref:ArsR/SmtB family transcription factor n=1 Tax=Desulfolucanica intricata TaxID=1285191 RepID=UPI0009ED7178|nr:metalloregulator ArsR/SmtB family transcription factor [Desulfolucanica intricata]
MNERDVCDIFCTDEKKVSRLREEVEITRGLASIFKVLADDTRIKIIYALSKEELCVCDVAGIIGSTVAAASHHLRLLKSMGLAKHRRQGKMVFYSLKDDCIQKIIATALNHNKAHKDN